MTPEEFDALFDSFASTVSRLETLPAYDVGGDEADRLAAARAGTPRPLRSVSTSPWLTRIAIQTIQQGKVWTRVRVLDDPLTDYESAELISYGEAQAVGEVVRIALRADVPGDVSDFWLFDAGLPGEHAVLMSYDAEGHWLGADLCTDPATLANLRNQLEEVLARTVSLNEFLAGRRG
ncbi:DUF6879 family protein [Pseudonocardia sp. CA-107938]|uniref:DUF6879 family protein n=1 Tax=Pseudonocardia sp. CA-107938 TaxID=3240021 RepID=UPI003D8B4527